MEAYLGDWVEETDYHHVGRIYAKHHDFNSTGETTTWFDHQTIPLKKSDKEKSWYSILIKDGGAALVPERNIILRSDLTKTDLTKTDLTKTDLHNSWESFYFRD